MKKGDRRDFVSGRLDETPGAGKGPRSDSAEKNTNYGTDRLGLTSSTDREPAEDAPSASPLGKNNSPHSLGSTLPHVKPRRIELTPITETAPFGPDELEFQELPETAGNPIDFLKFWKHGRQAMVLGMALTCMIVMLVLWAIVSVFVDDTTGPRTASAMDTTLTSTTGGGARGGTANVSTTVKTSTDDTRRSRRNRTSRKDSPRPKPWSSPQRPDSRVKDPADPTAASGHRANIAPSKSDSQKRPAPGSVPNPGSSSSGEKKGGTDAKRRDDKPFREYMACPPGFYFTGIVNTPEGKLASVNDTFLVVGDTINGAEIVEIRGFVVEMELKGKRFLLNSTARPPEPEEYDELDEEDGEEDESSDDEDEKDERSEESPRRKGRRKD